MKTPNLHAIWLHLLAGASFIVAQSASAEEKEVSVEEFLQGLSTVPGAVSRRDPFVESKPPFETPTGPTGDAGSLNESIPVMERYPLTDYEVVAVLLGDQYPRGLVRLPDREGRRVVIVKLNDKLGNRKGVIVKITKEGMKVQQSVRSKFGFVDKSEVLLKVGASADKQKQAQMAAQAQSDGQAQQAAPPAGPLGMPILPQAKNPPPAAAPAEYNQKSPAKK